MRLITTPTWSTSRRWNADLWREMDGFFDDQEDSEFATNATRSFEPAVEVQEEPNHFFLSVDLPGLKKNDIKIEAVDQRLMISGERKKETSRSSSQFQRVERSFGKFEKVFALPKNVDVDKIEANYEDGVLELLLPKLEAEQPKKIEIQAGKSGFFDKLMGSKRSEATQVS